jgi:adenosylcobinamide-GDP ribazoletransferase
MAHEEHPGGPDLAPWRREVQSWVADTLACLAFYSRLPVPRHLVRADPPGFSRAARASPLAGLLLGLLAGIVLAITAALGLPALLSASLGILALVCLSGALHEDGLSDFADAMGGTSPQGRLEIMRDSRVGTFGVLALVFSILIRIIALSHLLETFGALQGAFALASATALSRAAALWPLHALPPARTEGLGADVAGLPLATLHVALGLGALIAVAASAGTTLGGSIAGLLAAAAAVLLVTRLARCLIGGQTGDVAGAASQAAEIAFLVALTTLAAH